MKVLILLICVGLTLSARRSYERYILKYAENYFEEFIKTHNKIYADEAERQKRFEIFKDNLEMINRRNLEDETAVYGITKFCDLTTEEFIDRYTGFKGFGNTSCESPPRRFKGTAPESLDWRDKGVVTRIKDQGQCSSCWAFGAIGNLESQYALKYRKMVEFSEQQLVDCDTRSNGCNGSSALENAYLYWIENSGAELEEDYPYTAEDGQCKFNASKVKAKVTGCISYQPKSEDQLKELLNEMGPLIIGVDATYFSSYTVGILGSCPFQELNHAVLLVGYGKENGDEYWLIKNSWGETFGECGYIKIQRGVNACGILTSEVVSAKIA